PFGTGIPPDPGGSACIRPPPAAASGLRGGGVLVEPVLLDVAGDGRGEEVVDGEAAGEAVADFGRRAREFGIQERGAAARVRGGAVAIAGEDDEFDEGREDIGAGPAVEGGPLVGAHQPEQPGADGEGVSEVSGGLPRPGGFGAVEVAGGNFGMGN